MTKELNTLELDVTNVDILAALMAMLLAGKTFKYTAGTDQPEITAELQDNAEWPSIRGLPDVHKATVQVSTTAGEHRYVADYCHNVIIVFDADKLQVRYKKSDGTQDVATYEFVPQEVAEPTAA